MEASPVVASEKGETSENKDKHEKEKADKEKADKEKADKEKEKRKEKEKERAAKEKAAKERAKKEKSEKAKNIEAKQGDLFQKNQIHVFFIFSTFPKNQSVFICHTRPYSRLLLEAEGIHATTRTGCAAE